jgi:glycolate oxidase FAD binding subunit
VTLAIQNPHDAITFSTHQPATVGDVGDLVRQAAVGGQAIYPVGGKTQWELGLSPSKPGALLDIRRLDQVIDYPARDMTITVQAGMTIARLQEVLTAEKQRLPIDVPDADRATVGGTLAANVSGPRRYGFGTLRDYVIGISAVNNEGHEIKAGGRVVKNVAGYDLCKLFIGSLGTLGVITQVTLKVRPLPAEQAIFVFACSSEKLDRALAQLHGTRTRPICMEVLNPAAAARLAAEIHESSPTAWVVAVGFEDSAEALKWQVGQLVREIGEHHCVIGSLGGCADSLWKGLIEDHGRGDAVLSFKAGVPASRVASFCVETGHLLEPVRLQAHAGNGIVVGHCIGEDTVAQVRKVRELAMAAGGHLVVKRCPAAWKDAAFVWGPPRPETALMRAIKEKLDPKGIFNPGRFVV